MEFKQLNYILRVAELRNFTKAAESLYVTQPTLSHYIAKIEKEMGTPLFDRSTNPVSLTIAGEYYVETAHKILQMEANLKEKLQDIKELKTGTIKIGMPPARAAFVLPGILPRLKEKYPGIKVETMEKNSGILAEAVKNGTIDFALMPLHEDTPYLEGEVIYMEELFLVARKGEIPENAINADGVVDLNIIKDKPFVLLRKNRGIRQAIDDMFLHYGFEPNIAMETSSNSCAYWQAEAGLGLAIVPEVTLYSIREAPDLNIYHLSKGGMRWPLSFVHRRGEYLNVLKQDILEMIEDLFANTPHIPVNTHGNQG